MSGDPRPLSPPDLAPELKAIVEAPFPRFSAAEMARLTLSIVAKALFSADVSEDAETIGAALTVSLRRGGLLMAVLVLPLTIPVLIFGVAAASAASGGAAPFLTPFLMLCALSLFAIAAAPFAAAAALRHVRE